MADKKFLRQACIVIFVIEWLMLEGALKPIKFQTPAMGTAANYQPDQAAQVPRWGIPHSLGNLQ